MSASGGLERFFAPRSVAVLGASDDPDKIGYRVIRSLREYDGFIYPVHPAALAIDGRPAFASLAALPDPVDVIVAVVPAEALLAALHAAPRRCAQFLLALTSGFGEVPESAALQSELQALCAAREIRLVGPNSAGAMNVPRRYNASLIPSMPGSEAGVSFLTQSGGFGMQVWMYAHTYALDVARFCDVGNTAGVTLAEVLDAYADDSSTKVVSLFGEAVDAQGAWRKSLARAAARKPVVVANAARTPAGRRATTAHLGSSAGVFAPDAELEGGVRVVATIRDLLNVSKALLRQPAPRGRRVAIVSGSGGIGVELSDLCIDAGLEVPVLSEAVQREFAAILPSYAAFANPIDLTAAWPRYAEWYPPLVTALRRSGEVDVVIATLIDVATQRRELIDAAAALAGDSGTGVPLYVFWSSPETEREHLRLLERAGVPCFETPLETVRTIAAVAPPQG